jgi:hypothetical protein
VQLLDKEHNSESNILEFVYLTGFYADFNIFFGHFSAVSLPKQLSWTAYI